MEQETNINTRHILSILVQDVPGALARIVGLFTGRGHNINSLTVGHVVRTENGLKTNGQYSRITIVTSSNQMSIQHIIELIEKQIEVHKVIDLTDSPTCVEADVTLVKVYVSKSSKQAHALTVATLSFRATSIITDPDYLIFRFPGREDASVAFIRAMERFGKVESAYSGTIAIA